MNEKFSRREVLKLSGVALGSMAVVGNAAIGGENQIHHDDPSQEDSLFRSLKPFKIGTPLGSNEMRISFMGTSVVQLWVNRK